MVHLKEKLLSSFLAFENERDVDSYVHDIRTQAIKKFEEEGFPTKRLENWKYTSLKKSIKCLISPAPPEAIKGMLIDELILFNETLLEVTIFFVFII